MNSSTTVAVASAIKDAKVKAARKDLAPGIYPIDTTIRVHGSIEVAPDLLIAPTAQIPLKATLALFVRYSGISREAAMELLRKAMQTAIEQGKDAEEQIVEQCPAVREVMDLVQKEIIATLPKVSRKGAVKAILEVTEVTESQVAHAA